MAKSFLVLSSLRIISWFASSYVLNLSIISSVYHTVKSPIHHISFCVLPQLHRVAMLTFPCKNWGLNDYKGIATLGWFWHWNPACQWFASVALSRISRMSVQHANTEYQLWLRDEDVATCVSLLTDFGSSILPACGCTHGPVPPLLTVNWYLWNWLCTPRPPYPKWENPAVPDPEAATGLYRLFCPAQGQGYYGHYSWRTMADFTILFIFRKYMFGIPAYLHSLTFWL